jgi:hypothetical protein
MCIRDSRDANLPKNDHDNQSGTSWDPIQEV